MTENRKTLLTRSDLYALGISWSNSHMLNQEKIGAFPKRVYLSPQKVFWKEDEVHEFLAGRIAARGGVQ